MRGEDQHCTLDVCICLLIVQALLLCSGRLKEDVLSFREKGQIVLLGDFNARDGRSVEVDDVIGMFGEDTCNASGNRLISFLNEVELVVCNGRNLWSNLSGQELGLT